MSAVVAMARNSAHQIIEDACARNQSAEFVHELANEEQIFARVRLLASADDHLLIDLPMTEARPVLLDPGEPVCISFADGGKWVSFRSCAIGRRKVSIGAADPVPAMLITLPEELDVCHRRECYRLSTLHMPSAAVSFQSTGKGPDAACFEGMMVNVSETGCSVVFDRSTVPPLEREQVYAVSFMMFEDPEPFGFDAKVQWVDPDESGRRLQAGFAWILDPARIEDRQKQMHLGRCIMAEQCRLLRRGRLR